MMYLLSLQNGNRLQWLDEYWYSLMVAQKWTLTHSVSIIIDEYELIKHTMFAVML